MVVVGVGVGVVVGVGVGVVVEVVMGRRPSVAAPSPWVLGIDPSLTRSAAVLIPPGWELGDWKALKSFSYGEPPPDRKRETVLDYERLRIERMSRIAESLAAFVMRFAGGREIRGFIEGYAYHAGGAGSHSGAEYGGILRQWFALRHSIALWPVSEAQARKQLLGKLPPRDRKVVTARALYAAGAPFENDDECDAFVVAAFGLTEIGLTGFSLA